MTNQRILEAYEQMLSRSHNSSIIALDEGRTKFLAFHLVDAAHLETFLKRNNVPPPQAREIARKLTEKNSV